MATVKIKPNKSIARTLAYGFSHQQEGDPVSAYGCSKTLEGARGDFEAVKTAYATGSKRKVNDVTHIFQSWSPAESAHLTREAVNRMGYELASRAFPGHQFVVVTHSDRQHLHNHIVVNNVHPETGKRIHNKKKHLSTLRDINDEICLAKGLSIPNSETRERALRMSDKVRGILKHGRFSYVFDMAQKADLARAYATNYAEYLGILTELNVRCRIEDKNITYYYGKSTVGVRGRQLGKVYDKAGLEARFRTNDERFQAVPALRARVRASVDHVATSPGSVDDALTELSRDTGGKLDLNLRKDYSRFPRVPRREARTTAVSDHDLAASLIPVAMLRKARQASIFDYCRDNGIGLIRNDQGDFAIKGREYVTVKEGEWTNHKNRTSGSLIEFVAVHKNMTYLQSVAEITGNRRLLLLEETFGENKRTYTPFYVPKADEASQPEAIKRIGALLRSFRLSEHHAEALYQSKQAQVSKGGLIRLFGEEDTAGTIEFCQDDGGIWTRREQGKANRPFHARSGDGHSAKLYLDPFSFLKHEGWPARNASAKGEGILALLAPDHAVVGTFLAQNLHVDRLRVVSDKPADPREREFIAKLRAHYQSFGVEIELAQAHDRDHRDGSEISF